MCEVVSLEDLTSFMLTRETNANPKKAHLASKTKAERIWRHLLETVLIGHCLQNLVVRCPDCLELPMDCSCKSPDHVLDDGKWTWSHYGNWVIERHSLAALSREEFRGSYLHKATKDHVMAFVDHLKSTT